MNKFCSFFSFIFFIFLNVHCSLGQDASSQSLPMSFSGKVYMPIVCTFQETSLSIAFGDVDYSKLILANNSIQKSAIIYYTCTGGLESSSVSVKLSGEASTFGSNLIKTSLPELSIRFYIKPKRSDTNFVQMNTTDKYGLINSNSAATYFLINAELSNNPTAGEFSGEFTASASIQFIYI